MFEELYLTESKSDSV